MLALPRAGRAELPRRLGWEATRLPALANQRSDTSVLSWSGMLPRALGVPVTCYLANPLVFARDDPANLLRRASLARTVRWASHVLVPSRAMQSLLRTIPGCRPEVVPLGIDHECFTPGAAGGSEILCVADFYRHKRHDLVVEAWERLSAPRPLLRLIGEPLVDSAHAKALFERLMPYRLRGEIRVQSRISLRELVQAYARARVFLLASEQESFCMPLLEAQASGVPAVVRDIPALRETGGAGTTFVVVRQPGGVGRGCGSARARRRSSQPGCGGRTRALAVLLVGPHGRRDPPPGDGMTLRAGCAVVVCTKDRPQQLRRCLDALEALDPPGVGDHRR